MEPDELAEEPDLEETEESEEAEEIEEPEEPEEIEENEDTETSAEPNSEEAETPKKKTVWQMDSADTKEMVRPDRTPRSNQPAKMEKNSRQAGRKGLLEKLFYRGRHGS